jgi:hypothetical protein
MPWQVVQPLACASFSLPYAAGATQRGDHRTRRKIRFIVCILTWKKPRILT